MHLWQAARGGYQDRKMKALRRYVLRTCCRELRALPRQALNIVQQLSNRAAELLLKAPHVPIEDSTQLHLFSLRVRIASTSCGICGRRLGTREWRWWIEL